MEIIDNLVITLGLKTDAGIVAISTLGSRIVENKKRDHLHKSFGTHIFPSGSSKQSHFLQS